MLPQGDASAVRGPQTVWRHLPAFRKPTRWTGQRRRSASWREVGCRCCWSHQGFQDGHGQLWKAASEGQMHVQGVDRQAMTLPDCLLEVALLIKLARVCPLVAFDPSPHPGTSQITHSLSTACLPGLVMGYGFEVVLPTQELAVLLPRLSPGQDFGGLARNDVLLREKHLVRAATIPAFRLRDVVRSALMDREGEQQRRGQSDVRGCRYGDFPRLMHVGRLHRAVLQRAVTLFSKLRGTDLIHATGLIIYTVRFNTIFHYDRLNTLDGCNRFVRAYNVIIIIVIVCYHQYFHIANRTSLA